MVSFVSCATPQFISQTVNTQANHPEVNQQSEVNQMPNQYGWDNTNCAFIQADCHCAQPMGINALDIQVPMTPPTPAAGPWNSSNCAHIMADGNCAHPL